MIRGKRCPSCNSWNYFSEKDHAIMCYRCKLRLSVRINQIQQIKLEVIK